MKQRIKLNESDLNRIIIESVNKILAQEGLGDKIQGAVQGWQNGKKSGMRDTEDAQFLSDGLVVHKIY